MENKAEQGTSLVEVMMATVLIVVFVGALLTISIRQGLHRQTNLETSLALSAALENLETARSVSFAALAGLNGSGFDVPGANGNLGGLQPIPGDPDGLPGEIDVTAVPGTTNQLYRVTATVVWRGVNGPRRLGFETLIAERK